MALTEEPGWLIDRYPATPEAAQIVWDILVEECGALDDEVMSSQFMTWMAATTNGGEWRFMGALGFGGKFRWYGDRVYVDCYREDETPERKAMIERANARLYPLVQRPLRRSRR